MFEKNDYIIYGTTGVCNIAGIEKRNLIQVWKENIIF